MSNGMMRHELSTSDEVPLLSREQQVQELEERLHHALEQLRQEQQLRMHAEQRLRELAQKKSRSSLQRRSPEPHPAILGHIAAAPGRGLGGGGEQAERAGTGPPCRKCATPSHSHHGFCTKCGTPVVSEQQIGDEEEGKGEEEEGEDVD
jgi:hypothetical protein